ncbi:OmpA family protein [Oceanicoccus sp. KOV_DT_Chl]|uniref:OmpA family protein n=1 Tax=Oceanicoccus sp. KOV_DT_Chl TaxID=1904639 RepID=UPI000C797922|nr:OmpA family protein [Oceanicoccus sp. KOV_DT_Chl]
MKMSTFLPVLSLCAAVSTAAVADADNTSSEAKRLGVVTGSIVVGVASLGPLGAVPGILAGAWLDQEIMAADRVEVMESELLQANTRIRSMGEQLAAAQLSTQEYARIALEQLQLELLFKTNNSALTEHGVQRLTFLANFLSENPEIQIRLDGYADPRGDAVHNLALSEQRAASVLEHLVTHGVARNRIETYSHGAAQSVSVAGDYDSYALDRVVKIQLSQQNKAAFAGIMIAD